MFRWFAERSARREAAEKIYDSIVAQSRNPVFYVRCGVPDTLSGRFDMLVIHMFIVMQNLKLGASEGKLLGKEIIEAFVREMDSMVRDLGIADIYVAQEVRKIADLFYRQLVVYTNAVEQKNNDGSCGSDLEKLSVRRRERQCRCGRIVPLYLPGDKKYRGDAAQPSPSGPSQFSGNLRIETGRIRAATGS